MTLTTTFYCCRTILASFLFQDCSKKSSPQETADFLTFTEEILKSKLHFFSKLQTAVQALRKVAK